MSPDGYLQLKEHGGTLITGTGGRQQRARRRKGLVIVMNPAVLGWPKRTQRQSEHSQYTHLDERIANAQLRASLSAKQKGSATTAPTSRALRWASDRIEGSGRHCLRLNSSFIDAAPQGGVRICRMGFSQIFILRPEGSQRTSRRAEPTRSGKIFRSVWSGKICESCRPHVRNLRTQVPARIFCGTGGLPRQRSSTKIAAYGSAEGISAADIPAPSSNRHCDWIE